MSTAVVLPGTPPAAAPPGAAPAQAPPAAAPTAAELALQAKLDAAEATSAEHERNAKFWYEKAKGEKPVAPKEPGKQEEPEEDLLDLITAKGEKGLDALLKKRGFVKAEDVDGRVNAKADQITSEAQLLKEYPDLGNKQSEFFQATALHYGQLKQRGVPESEAMSLGAQLAELEGIRSGKIKTPTQKTAEDKERAAEERRQRALAGGGDRNTRTATEEEDDIPTADEMLAINRLADALDISVEKATERYKARAKKGVQVALRMGNR